MCENKKEMPVEEIKYPETNHDNNEEQGKELSIDQLENVTGGSMRDTVRTKTHDITDSIKDRI